MTLGVAGMGYHDLIYDTYYRCCLCGPGGKAPDDDTEAWDMGEVTVDPDETDQRIYVADHDWFHWRDCPWGMARQTIEDLGGPERIQAHVDTWLHICEDW